MTTLQNDILEIYNSLVEFSDNKVRYEKETRLLIFEQKGKTVYLGLPVYYCLALEDLEKPTYLLPEDYDYLMSTLQSLIASGELIKPRTCLGPENYGFNVYSTNINEMYKGPDVIGQVKFISGTSWLFKFRTRKKYKL